MKKENNKNPEINERTINLLRNRIKGLLDEHDDYIEDAIQEAILYHLENPHIFDNTKSNLDTYLYIIAKSRILNYYKVYKNRFILFPDFYF